MEYDIAASHKSSVFQPVEKIKNHHDNPHKTVHDWLLSLDAIGAEHELIQTTTRGLNSEETTCRHMLDKLILTGDNELQSIDKTVSFELNLKKDSVYSASDLIVLKHAPDQDPVVVGRMIMNFTDEGFVPHVLFPR